MDTWHMNEICDVYFLQKCLSGGHFILPINRLNYLAFEHFDFNHYLYWNALRICSMEVTVKIRNNTPRSSLKYHAHDYGVVIVAEIPHILCPRDIHHRTVFSAAVSLQQMKEELVISEARSLSLKIVPFVRMGAWHMNKRYDLYFL